MSAEDEEKFPSSKKCWICNKLFLAEYIKTRDHYHVLEKCRGSAHWSCNTKKVPVIFHNLKNYDGHLIMQEISKYDEKISVILNGLEKYTAFISNNNLVFIDGMEFMNSSVDALVKNLSHNYFKHLSQEFNGSLLELLKQKGMYTYDFMDNFKKFSVGKLPNRSKFLISLKD